MKEKNLVVRSINFLTFIVFLGLIFVILLQVWARTPFLVKAPHWTEEVSRMMFIAMICLGAVSATIKDEFVAVDIFTSKLKGKALIIYNIVFDILLSIVFLSLTPACLKFLSVGSKQLSPSLRLNMKYIYIFIVILIVGMGLAKIYRAILGFISLKNYDKEQE